MGGAGVLQEVRRSAVRFDGSKMVCTGIWTVLASALWSGLGYYRR